MAQDRGKLLKWMQGLTGDTDHRDAPYIQPDAIIPVAVVNPSGGASGGPGGEYDFWMTSGRYNSIRDYRLNPNSPGFNPLVKNDNTTDNGGYIQALGYVPALLSQGFNLHALSLNGIQKTNTPWSSGLALAFQIIIVMRIQSHLPDATWRVVFQEDVLLKYRDSPATFAINVFRTGVENMNENLANYNLLVPVDINVPAGFEIRLHWYAYALEIGAGTESHSVDVGIPQRASGTQVNYFPNGGITAHTVLHGRHNISGIVPRDFSQ